MAADLRSIIPPYAYSLSDLRIDPEIISNQIVKELYIHGKETPRKLAKRLKLDNEIVQKLIFDLKKSEIVGMTGGSGLGGDYEYSLYPTGIELAKNILERDKYIGPAPVSFDEYIRVTKEVLKANLDTNINKRTINDKFSQTVGYTDVLTQIGQVICARKPAFVYGYPGNGKTFLCSSVASVLPPMVIPYAVEIGNQLVRMFDPSCHKRIESFDMDGFDERWVVVEAPMIVMGGELTMADLDVKYNEKFGCFDAPPQVKATGGVLLIDDLGRQRCSVEEIFNRFIIPLANHVDFLVLGGQRMEVPTDEIILFSTNIDPAKIVDDAFLRRLPYKIYVRNPSLDEYTDLWKSACAKFGLKFDAENINHVKKLYDEDKRGFRAVQPKDLVSLIADRKKFLEISDSSISAEEIDVVYKTYFISDLTMKD